MSARHKPGQSPAVGQEEWETVSTDGWRARCHLSRNLFSGELDQFDQAAALLCLLHSSPCFMSEALATAVQQEENVPVTISIPETEGSQAPGPSDSLAYQTGSPPLPVTPFPDIPFVGTPPVQHPFLGFRVNPSQEKWDHSPSGPLSDQCNKQTHVNSQEVKIRSKHNSTQGDEITPKLVLEAGPSSEPQGQGSTSSPSSPT